MQDTNTNKHFLRHSSWVRLFRVQLKFAFRTRP